MRPAERSAEGVAKPHLIVVPLSTAPNWLREFQAWAPHLNVIAFSGNQVRQHAVQEPLTARHSRRVGQRVAEP